MQVLEKKMMASSLHCYVVSLVMCFILCFCGFGHALDRAMYLLGASIVDVGNNNFLPNLAKANYIPYGIDFTDGKATGRFSNGKNAADFLAELLGLPSPKPYLSFINSDIVDEFLKGINFASAGAGILDSTYEGYCIPFSQQVRYFNEMVNIIGKEIGPEKAKQHISNSFIVINIGDNDILAVSGAQISSRILEVNDSEISSTKLGVDPEEYVSKLIDTLRPRLKDVSNLGARKVIILSTGAQGCLPVLRSKTEKEECNEDANELSILYNKKLASLMEELKSEYDLFRYSFFNVYNAFDELNKNPSTYGLTVLKVACCGTGKLNGTIRCPPGTIPCSNRADHMFWDNVHNTEAVTSVYMNFAFQGSAPYVYPINVKQLSDFRRPYLYPLYPMNVQQFSDQ